MDKNNFPAKYYLYAIHKEFGFSHLTDISNSKKEIENTINEWKRKELDKSFEFVIQKNY